MTKVGLESSSIMPLVTITPLTQDCYETILNDYSDAELVAHEDSITELKSIFSYKSNTFYSNPITRMEKLKDLPRFTGLSLKGIAIKLLLDGQAGGWIGNKNSRVQTFFFSDVIDNISNEITNPEEFTDELTLQMRRKIEHFNNLLTANNGTIRIESTKILSYWGHHNISSSLLDESKILGIKILPNNESFSMFENLDSAIRRDSYHYHMLKKDMVDTILVGDANYKKNICSCIKCSKFECEIHVLTDSKRKQLLKLK